MTLTVAAFSDGRRREARPSGRGRATRSRVLITMEPIARDDVCFPPNRTFETSPGNVRI